MMPTDEGTSNSSSRVAVTANEASHRTATSVSNGGGALICAPNPVAQNPTHCTDIIVDEAKTEDLSSQIQSQAAEQFKAPDLTNVISKAESSSTAVVQDDEEVGEELDEESLWERDIELVITLTRVSRPRAVKALNAADGDIVSVIMELTA